MVGQSPKAVSKRIGREYVKTDTLPFEGTNLCKMAYEKLARHVCDLFDQIPVTVQFQTQDPYESYEDMARTVGKERKLRIYSGQADVHPILSESETLKFRAVHDWFGHLKNDVDFSAEGEFKKWANMEKELDRDTRRVLFAEVVGQVGQAHYLRDGFDSEDYTQRAFLAPIHWIHWMETAVETE